MSDLPPFVEDDDGTQPVDGGDYSFVAETDPWVGEFDDGVDVHRGLPMEGLSFKSQLLGLNRDPSSDFILIRQLFPVESSVFEPAIVFMARRAERDPSMELDANQLVRRAKVLLTSTLHGYADEFATHAYKSPIRDDFQLFAKYSKPWAKAQLKACCTAVASALVSDYRSTSGPGLSPEENSSMQSAADQISLLQGRPEAKRLLQILLDRYEEWAKVLESRRPITPIQARCLSYTLCSHSGGVLTDKAAASLILKGNDSPASRAFQTPLQVLDASDVASIFNLPSGRSVTTMVSKFRGEAMSYQRLSDRLEPPDVTGLWTRIDLRKLSREDIEAGDDY